MNNIQITDDGNDDLLPEYNFDYKKAFPTCREKSGIEESLEIRQLYVAVCV